MSRRARAHEVISFQRNLEPCGVRACQDERTTTQDHGRCRCTDSNTCEWHKSLNVEEHRDEMAITGVNMVQGCPLSSSNQAVLARGSILQNAKSSLETCTSTHLCPHNYQN